MKPRSAKREKAYQPLNSEVCSYNGVLSTILICPSYFLCLGSFLTGGNFLQFAILGYYLKEGMLEILDYVESELC